VDQNNRLLSGKSGVQIPPGVPRLFQNMGTLSNMTNEEMQARIYRLEDCLLRITNSLLRVEDSNGVEDRCESLVLLARTLECINETLNDKDLSIYS
jgi:hypothetical protein